MRIPTPEDEQFRWWRSALVDDEPLIIDEPQCGFYRRRMARGGVWVPAKVWMTQEIDVDGYLEEDEKLHCMVNGRMHSAYDEWLWLAHNPISEADYNHLVSLQAWALRNDPDSPEANPHKPVDWVNTPAPTFKK